MVDQTTERKAEVLRMVLGFLDVNPAKLSPEARSHWLRELRRTLVAPPGGVAMVPRLDDDDLGAVADLLRVVHSAVSTGVRSLLAGEPWSLPGRSSSLRALQLRGRQPERWRIFHVDDGDQEADSIILGIAELIRTTGETLRSCRADGCTRIFLGQKRGVFCSRTCQQREMNRRKARRRSRKGRSAPMPETMPTATSATAKTTKLRRARKRLLGGRE